MSWPGRLSPSSPPESAVFFQILPVRTRGNRSPWVLQYTSPSPREPLVSWQCWQATPQYGYRHIWAGQTFEEVDPTFRAAWNHHHPFHTMLLPPSSWYIISKVPPFKAQPRMARLIPLICHLCWQVLLRRSSSRESASSPSSPSAVKGGREVVWGCSGHLLDYGTGAWWGQ